VRERQAQATRGAILEAARELFVQQGYGATTVEQIARRAGVSKPTVFSAVGNKETVLRTVRDVAIAGDDAPVPMRQRPVVEEVRDEPGVRRAVDLLARHLTEVAGRYAEINEVVHAAADSGTDELRGLWEAEEAQRLTGARFWIDVLAAKGQLATSHTKKSAVDVLWLLMAPDNYFRLVHRRGWTVRKYEAWLGSALGQLFPGAR
jgi:AcrR family transcriptional regulator